MRFNQLTRDHDAVVNYEGARAYALDPALELYSAVVTASLSGNQFYEKESEKLTRIRELVAKADPRFVAQLAVYARQQMHLRSIPLVLAVELARIHRGDDLVGRLVARVVQRADEITELLACYVAANERRGSKQLGGLSKQVQHGLAEAFNRFDAYQFAKYNRAGAAVSLRDALFLVHPQAKSSAQQVVFDQIATTALPVPYTWETELSALGQGGFEGETARQIAVRQTWETLIASGNVGYMALLRNLRNILAAGVSREALAHVCRVLSNAHNVANARQLPFRYLAAYRELNGFPSGRVPLVLDALETAVAHAAVNIPGFGEETRVVLAADVSSSMQRPISPRSKIQNFDIGLMLAMLLQSRCRNVTTGIFGDRWKTIQLPRQNVLANVEEFHRREGEVGYSTNGHLVVQDLFDRREVVDKILLFTDCQLWNS
ncbi:MAG: TROVE domain-containing protein, partial [Sphingobacteriaceae bacterium]|nr:TROVE domain-containing protein [Cytophagaceae bacterium]